MSTTSTTKPSAPDPVVWASNIGGNALTTADGTYFSADTSVSGGEVRTMSGIKGSQDPALYETYREGDLDIRHELPNGRYAVTFYFAEPNEAQRRFDVYVADQLAIGQTDVRGWRDGKADSGLTVTIPDVVIEDGELVASLKSAPDAPLLSAISVRLQARQEPRWPLLWSDEFDVDGAPNPDRWNVEQWSARKVNDEDQAYTDRVQNLEVKDGLLRITAHKEDYDNAAYTSGRIQSQGKGDVLYGRVDVRAKLPFGQGTWPAIWMLPSDPFRYATTCEAPADWQGSETCDAWPNSGEIDIMEHVGYQMGHVHGTVHTRAYYWLLWEQRKGRILLDDVSDDFHVYSMEWTPERIDVFVDDVRYFTYLNEGTGWESWPFDHPFHVILNVAVGGAWGRAGGPIDDSVFPQTMLVDYVRVYGDAVTDQ
ncbi:MAG: family 16 glycosylhydrolase [Woeseiaceae bacterium]